MRMMRFRSGRLGLMSFHWSTMRRPRLYGRGVLLVRLDRSGMRLLRNLNWRGIVTRLFDRCVPIASSTSGHVAIVVKLFLAGCSGLIRLGPPRGLGGRLGLMSVVSHVVFAQRILSEIVAHVGVGRRTIVRTEGRPIIGLSRGEAGIVMLPDDDERTQGNCA